MKIFESRNRKKSQQLLEEAIELTDDQREDDAILIYEKIIKLRSDWITPYYNLGLIYKYRSDWKLSFYYNKEASKIDPDHEEAWWNLGIAATALKLWRQAREAWVKCGVEMEINDDEPVMELGNTPIRLNNKTEVVWAKRVDPARAIILNIPFPESGRKYQDQVLNDGAPQGYRVINDVEYPVFNELQLLQRSKYKTFSCKVHTGNESLIEKLDQFCKDYGIEMEDWSTVKYLCKQCSEGTVHDEHDHDLQPKSENNAVIGFAALDHETLLQILEKWRIVTLCDYEELVTELE